MNLSFPLAADYPLLPQPEITSGSKGMEALVGIFNKLQTKCLLIVTDPGIVKAGVLEQLQSFLPETLAQNTFVFDKVSPDPEISLTLEAVDFGRSKNIDTVIGLGGGSSIDVAKIVAALVPSTQKLDEIVGTDLITGSVLPLIAIPTTAGTGSEATPISILSDPIEQLKKGVVSSKIIPPYAILDSRLSVGLPKKQTAFTGLDALCHASEAFLSKNANPHTDFYAIKALKLIEQNLVTAYNDGKNLEARENMLIASFYAGVAFANAGVTAAHAFAYPIGARYHLPHGLAVILMLPAVLEYTLKDNQERFAQLTKELTDQKSDDPEYFIQYLNDLRVKLEMPRNLSDVDVPAELIPELSAGALKVERLLKNNRRSITTIDEAVSIFERAHNYA